MKTMSMNRIKSTRRRKSRVRLDPSSPEPIRGGKLFPSAFPASSAVSYFSGSTYRRTGRVVRSARQFFAPLLEQKRDERSERA